MDTISGNNQPKVNVIIPTRNSSKYLARTLASIRNQTYKNFGIIVVDNFSKDNSREIAFRYGTIFVQIAPERATQLNYGIYLTDGKYIYETGSDMVSEPTYIEEAVDKCEKEGYDAIYSSVVSSETKNFWGKVKAFERKMYIGDDQIEAAHFFRRTVFDILNGYDNRLISVEEDFQHRLDKKGFKTGRIKAREIHLAECKTLKEVALKSFYYGTYIRGYLKKHPTRGTQYLFPLRKAFIKNWKEYVKHPILSIGFIIYKFIQQTAGFLGLLINKNIHRKVYG